MKMSLVERFFVNSARREARIERVARDLLGSVKLAGNGALLDLGCGTGAAARYVAREKQFDVTGVDIDPGQLELARTRAGEAATRMRFLEADATSLPFHDRTFDIVLSFMAMHHVPSWRTALDEVARILKPGGSFMYRDISSRRRSRF
jgi:ubiquinone/menaquinone biosynthesis C-methylase UbiE